MGHSNGLCLLHFVLLRVITDSAIWCYIILRMVSTDFVIELLCSSAHCTNFAIAVIFRAFTLHAVQVLVELGTHKPSAFNERTVKEHWGNCYVINKLNSLLFIL